MIRKWYTSFALISLLPAMLACGQGSTSLMQTAREAVAGKNGTQQSADPNDDDEALLESLSWGRLRECVQISRPR